MKKIMIISVSSPQSPAVSTRRICRRSNGIVTLIHWFSVVFLPVSPCAPLRFASDCLARKRCKISSDDRKTSSTDNNNASMNRFTRNRIEIGNSQIGYSNRNEPKKLARCVCFNGHTQCVWQNRKAETTFSSMILTICVLQSAHSSLECVQTCTAAASAAAAQKQLEPIGCHLRDRLSGSRRLVSNFRIPIADFLERLTSDRRRRIALSKWTLSAPSSAAKIANEWKHVRLMCK